MTNSLDDQQQCPFHTSVLREEHPSRYSSGVPILTEVVNLTYSEGRRRPRVHCLQIPLKRVLASPGLLLPSSVDMKLLDPPGSKSLSNSDSAMLGIPIGEHYT